MIILGAGILIAGLLAKNLERRVTLKATMTRIVQKVWREWKALPGLSGCGRAFWLVLDRRIDCVVC
jgi:energy-converting hydrogenase Eha subunit G